MIFEYQFYSSIRLINFHDLTLNSTFNIYLTGVSSFTILAEDYIAIGTTNSEIYMVNIFNEFDYCNHNKKDSFANSFYELAYSSQDKILFAGTVVG